MDRAIRRPLAALALCAATTVGAGADTAAAPRDVSGAYLKGRHAALSSDYERAARHYAEALLLDRGNRRLMESAVSAFLAAGDAPRAAAVARLIEGAGGESQVGSMALLIERARTGDWDAILRAQDEGREVGPLMDALARGWAQMGRGDSEAALSSLRAVSSSRGLGNFGRLHEALARGALGDWAGAERVFAGRDEAGERVADPLRLSRRVALTRITVLSRLGRDEHAVALLDHLFGERLEPGLAALRVRLAAGERVTYAGPRDAREGMAEAFFSVAVALRRDAAGGYVLLYARAAEAMTPEHGDATLLTASLLHGLERHQEARARYAAISADHPAHPAARLGLARSLRALGRGEEAVAVLRALSEDRPGAAAVHLALGDALRAEGRDAEALATYDRALAAQADPARAPWRLHYARAVARERVGDWSGARADLARALEIEPDEPRVLHHLGAAMMERGEAPGDALALIERALRAAPEDAAVAGSLGRALHRLGRVGEAVEQLERAAAMAPLDVRLNDHLGDALWDAGRRREARFQWRRALGLDPAAEVTASLRLKLARGLDAATIGAEHPAMALAAER